MQEYYDNNVEWKKERKKERQNRFKIRLNKYIGRRRKEERIKKKMNKRKNINERKVIVCKWKKKKRSFYKK